MGIFTGFIWPVFKIAAITVVAKGVLLVLGEFDIFPEKWVASLLGGMIDSGAAGWLLAGIIGISGMLAWEWHSRRVGSNSADQLTPVAADKKSFPLWEAASLLAGTPIQRNLTGEAAAFLHQLKARMVQDKYGRNMRRFKFPAEMMALEVERIPDSTEIGRGTFKAFALSAGKKIRGLTDDD